MTKWPYLRTMGWIVIFCATFLQTGNTANGVEIARETAGVWRPWPSGKYHNLITRKNLGEPEEKLKIQIGSMEKRLERITRIFQKSHPFNPPMGFDVRPYPLIPGNTPFESYWRKTGNAPLSEEYPAVKHLPFVSILRMNLFTYFKRCKSCSAKVDSHFQATIRIYVNSVFESLGQGVLPFRKYGKERVFTAPAPSGAVGGFPSYKNGKFVVVTNIKKPLWLPIGQAYYLKREIQARQAQLAKMQPQAADSPSGKWLAARGKRKQDFEKLYELIKQSNPKQAENMKAMFEQQEKTMEKSLGNSQGEMKKGQGKALQFMENDLRRLRNRLATLSPAQRDSPAYMAPGRKYMPSGLAGKSAPGAVMLIKLNENFFPPGRPRDKFQLFVVEFVEINSGRKPFHREVLRGAQKALDWNAIQGLLE